MISLQQKKKILSQVEIFKNLPDHFLEMVAKRMGSKQFSTGSFLFHQNDNSEQFFVIYKGEVKITVSGVTVAALKEGEILGEMGVITGDKRSASAVANQETSVFFLQREVFDSLLCQVPDFAKNLMRMLSFRLKATTEKMSSSSSLDATPSPSSEVLQTEKKHSQSKRCLNCYEYNQTKTLRCVYCGEFLNFKLYRFLVNSLCLFFLLTSLFVFSKLHKKEQPEVEIANLAPLVEVDKVKTQTVNLKVSGYGQVHPQRLVKIISQVNGRVVKIHSHLRAGKFIPEGELLLETDNSDYQLAISRAQTQIKSAQSQIHLLKKQQENLAHQIRFVEESVKIAQEIMQREQILYQANRLSEKEWADARQTYLSLASALAELKTKHSVLPQQIATSESTLNDAKLVWNDAQNQEARTRIFCPFTARIQENRIEVGTVVNSGEILCVLEDSKAVEIRTMIHRDLLAKLFQHPALINRFSNEKHELHANVTNVIGGKDYTWLGKVIRFEPMDTSSYSIPLIVLVENPWENSQSPALQAGEFVKVTLQGRRIENAFTIPYSALREDNTLYVVKNQQLQIRSIKITDIVDDLVIIEEGVEAGEEFIVSPISYPVNNMKVKISEYQP